MGQDAALEIVAELLLDKLRKWAPVLYVYERQEGLEILLHNLVEDRTFRLVALVGGL